MSGHEIRGHQKEEVESEPRSQHPMAGDSEPPLLWGKFPDIRIPFLVFFFSPLFYLFA